MPDTVETEEAAMPEELTQDQTPTTAVRVFRDGQLVATEWCDSEEDAAEVAERWTEQAGVVVEVDGLSYQHRPGDILAPEPAESAEPDESPGPDRGTVGAFEPHVTRP